MPPTALLRCSRNLLLRGQSIRTPRHGLGRLELESTRPLGPPPSQFRPFSSTHPGGLAAQEQDPERNPHPQRDAQQDREKMAPESNEYAKSGTDDTTAANEDAAFNPNITDPQEAKDKAGEGNEVNPLDASPANPDISQGTQEEEGGAKKKESEGGGGRN